MNVQLTDLTSTLCEDNPPGMNLFCLEVDRELGKRVAIEIMTDTGTTDGKRW